MKKLLKLNNVIEQELTKAEICNVKGGISAGGAIMGTESCIDCGLDIGEDQILDAGSNLKRAAQ